ncbi:DnaD domain protein [Allofustis seminis]|uniref:DnaD domain protein n=1 Tax=Allofustis seminis TaxID=166939 RepID=UPI00036A087E|nr:DnaD domain protein [Allofustis seminis]
MSEYFSHDSNARNDEKCLNLRMKHGAAGYGIYWMLIERLRDQEDYTSVKDYNALAFDLRADAGVVKSVVEDFGLFAFTENEKGECFYSESLNRRMSMMEDISSKRAAAGKKGAQKRWNKKDKDGKKITKDSKAMANATKDDSKATTIAMAKNGNKKKIKENKINKNKIKDNKDHADVKNDQRPREKCAQNENGFQKISRIYQENIGVLTPLIAQDLQQWVIDLNTEVVVYALQLTIKKGASYSYAKAIMKNWIDKNIQTLEQAKAESLAFKKKTMHGRRVESIPDWMKNEKQNKSEYKNIEQPIPNEEVLKRLERVRT